MKNKFIAVALVATVAGSGLFAAKQAFAANLSQTHNEHMSSIVQKIADKFGLKTEDVQAVFDQERAEHEAKMEADYEAKLTKLVEEGKLTEAQKQLILTKNKELKASFHSNLEKMENMTDEERKAVMKTQKAELDAWAKQNNIDVKYLMFGRVKIMKHDPGEMGNRMIKISHTVEAE